MVRRPPSSTPLYSSAASDVYKRQPVGRQPRDLIHRLRQGVRGPSRQGRHHQRADTAAITEGKRDRRRPGPDRSLVGYSTTSSLSIERHLVSVQTECLLITTTTTGLYGCGRLHRLFLLSE